MGGTGTGDGGMGGTGTGTGDGGMGGTGTGTGDGGMGGTGTGTGDGGMGGTGTGDGGMGGTGTGTGDGGMGGTGTGDGGMGGTGTGDGGMGGTGTGDGGMGGTGDGGMGGDSGGSGGMGGGTGGIDGGTGNIGGGTGTGTGSTGTGGGTGGAGGTTGGGIGGGTDTGTGGTGGSGGGGNGGGTGGGTGGSGDGNGGDPGSSGDDNGGTPGGGSQSLPALQATGTTPIAATEGTLFTTSVAVLNDQSPQSQYTVTIDWGDKSIPTAEIATDGEGTPTIAIGGSHTYAEEGTYTAQVSISDNNNRTASASVEVDVADPQLTELSGIDVSAKVGAAFTGIVAAFSDPAPQGTADENKARITLDDGTTASANVQADPNDPTLFDVVMTATFNTPGLIGGVVQITHEALAPVLANFVVNAQADGPGPKIVININDTVDTSDDITSFNSGPNGIGGHAIRAAIVDAANAGPGTIQLSVTGNVSIDQTNFNITPGQTIEVTITPTGVSQKVDDVLIQAKWMPTGQVVGSGKMTVASITIPAHIRASDTPTNMADRIPPRVESEPFQVVVTPNLAGSNKFVQFRGSQLDGLAWVKIKSTSTVTITRNTQTLPNFGGENHAQGAIGGILVCQSEGYSIAAIPVNLTMTLMSTGTYRGFVVARVKHAWTSDSGDIGDLDQVHIKEQVEDQPGATGSLAGLPAMTSNDKYTDQGNFGSLTDRNGIGFGNFGSGAGTLNKSQLFMFEDNRTGSQDIVMGNSGYKISVTVHGLPLPFRGW